MVDAIMGAITGSHSVNGVAELHTQILRDSIFPELDQLRTCARGLGEKRVLICAEKPAAAEVKFAEPHPPLECALDRAVALHEEDPLLVARAAIAQLHEVFHPRVLQTRDHRLTAWGVRVKVKVRVEIAACAEMEGPAAPGPHALGSVCETADDTEVVAPNLITGDG